MSVRARVGMKIQELSQFGGCSWEVQFEPEEPVQKPDPFGATVQHQFTLAVGCRQAQQVADYLEQGRDKTLLYSVYLLKAQMTKRGRAKLLSVARIPRTARTVEFKVALALREENIVWH